MSNDQPRNSKPVKLPKPEKPLPEECCGSGCVPCIYDYYYDTLEKWETQQKELGLDEIVSTDGAHVRNS